MRPATDGEITYYAQLGVEPTASTEQIRETYRSLVRLLHPDQQTDPPLKAIAEAQMRILNRIYGVLSDSEKRLKYDQFLQGGHDRPSLVVSDESAVQLKRWVKRGGLALAGAAVLAVLVWTISSATRDGDEASELAQKALTKTSAGTATDSSDEVERLRAEVRDLETERNRALEELARLHGGGTATIPAPRTEARHPATATSLSSAIRSSFGGAWYWSRAMEISEARGSYRPEFIEATLSEHDGVIKGAYTARYRTSDASINPDVSFEFAATLAGPILICPWTGPGGARGEVMIRQTSKDSLQVDWTASQLGTRQRVSTGSAVLARKTE